MEKTQTLQFEGAAERVDCFLAGAMEGYSREFLKTLIIKGSVAVNGKKIKPSYMLEPGDKIEIRWDKPPANPGKLESIIIHEDKHLLVISKPAGLLVHPTGPTWENKPQALFSGKETLVSLIVSARPGWLDSGVQRAGLVHRLDRGTSGVMALAKTPQAQEKLAALFQGRKVDKIYNGIVCGNIKDDNGLINVPIGRVTGGKLKASPLGRSALTGYKVLERKNNFTLVELRPKTGRTNQLRIHLFWLGHPVLGDAVYGGKPAGRLMLHSKSISFIHPVNAKPVFFEAPLPEDFIAEWKKASEG